jgi:hypothetical protein
VLYCTPVIPFPLFGRLSIVRGDILCNLTFKSEQQCESATNNQLNRSNDQNAPSNNFKTISKRPIRHDSMCYRHFLYHARHPTSVDHLTRLRTYLVSRLFLFRSRSQSQYTHSQHSLLHRRDGVTTCPTKGSALYGVQSSTHDRDPQVHLAEPSPRFLQVPPWLPKILHTTLPWTTPTAG